MVVRTLLGQQTGLQQGGRRKVYVFIEGEGEKKPSYGGRTDQSRIHDGNNTEYKAGGVRLKGGRNRKS